jgi:hypothetical protein
LSKGLFIAFTDRRRLFCNLESYAMSNALSQTEKQAHAACLVGIQ